MGRLMFKERVLAERAGKRITTDGLWVAFETAIGGDDENTWRAIMTREELYLRPYDRDNGLKYWENCFGTKWMIEKEKPWLNDVAHVMGLEVASPEEVVKRVFTLMRLAGIDTEGKVGG